MQRTRYPLRLQLLSSFVIVYFLTTAFLVLFLYTSQVGGMKERLGHEKDYLLGSISGTLAVPLWNFDLEGVRSSLASAMDFPDLLSVAVYNERGGFLLGARRDSSSQVRIQGAPGAGLDPPGPAPAGSNLAGSVKISYEGRPIGRTDIVLTDSFARTALLHELWRSLALSSVIILAGIAGLFLSLQLGLVRRLVKLRDVLNSFSVSDLGVRAEVEGSDEISDLAQDFNGLAGSIQQYSARLEGLVEEKTVLLREIHHRVKNNLQVISSLVSLQEASYRDEADKEKNRDTQARVRSMAQLHELLYDSKDLASIDPADYLKSIAGELSLGFHYGRASIHIDASPDVLAIDEALPFGLIATELLTNALKYAYPAEGSGRVFVSYRRRGELRSLEVRDEGIGLPPDFDPETAASMGFILVRSLVEQIRGKLAIRRADEDGASPGLSVVVTFPARGA